MFKVHFARGNLTTTMKKQWASNQHCVCTSEAATSHLLCGRRLNIPIVSPCTMHLSKDLCVLSPQQVAALSNASKGPMRA